jgi:hypothetical protein
MTDEAIALLNDKFVPFAPRYAGTIDGYPWWQAMHKELNAKQGEKFHLCSVPGTSFSVHTSAGQPVPARMAKHTHGKSDLAEVLKQVVELYKQLPEGQRRPADPIADANRPEPEPPAGGLVLVTYDRPLVRDRDGHYHSLTGPDQRQKQLRESIPGQPGAQRDALWLTAAEWQSLVPNNPQKGQTIAVPRQLTKRIGLFGLTVRSAMQEFYQWTPDSVRQGDLELTVESVSPTAVQMRLSGSILLTAKTRQMEGHINEADLKTLENRYDARLEGKLIYDPAKKRFVRWDMIALGDYTGGCCACDYGKAKEEGHFVAKAPLPIAMSFEIDNNNYELPPEYRRSTPYLIWRFRNQSPFYFDPDKWEADWRKRNQK